MPIDLEIDGVEDSEVIATIPYNTVIVYLLPGDVVSMIAIKVQKLVQRTDGSFIIQCLD